MWIYIEKHPEIESASMMLPAIVDISHYMVTLEGATLLIQHIETHKAVEWIRFRHNKIALEVMRGLRSVMGGNLDVTEVIRRATTTAWEYGEKTQDPLGQQGEQ